MCLPRRWQCIHIIRLHVKNRCSGWHTIKLHFCKSLTCMHALFCWFQGGGSRRGTAVGTLRELYRRKNTGSVVTFCLINCQLDHVWICLHLWWYLCFKEFGYAWKAWSQFLRPGIHKVHSKCCFAMHAASPMHVQCCGTRGTCAFLPKKGPLCFPAYECTLCEP
jgi:hypothetical protein